jgi:CRP-like cAMP-binding protein
MVAGSNARYLLFGAGQLFGELPLLDGGPRTATVVCHSKEVDVMVWKQAEFMSLLQGDPPTTFKICRILGSRLRAQIEKEQTVFRDESLIARVLLGASEGGQEPVDTKSLAAECGLWPDELQKRLEAFIDKGWIAFEPPNAIRVTVASTMEKLVAVE